MVIILVKDSVINAREKYVKVTFRITCDSYQTPRVLTLATLSMPVCARRRLLWSSAGRSHLCWVWDDSLARLHEVTAIETVPFRGSRDGA